MKIVKDIPDGHIITIPINGKEVILRIKTSKPLFDGVETKTLSGMYTNKYIEEDTKVFHGIYCSSESLL